MQKLINVLLLFSKIIVQKFKNIIDLSFIKNKELIKKSKLYRTFLFIISVALVFILIIYFAMQYNKNVNDRLMTEDIIESLENKDSALVNKNNVDNALGLQNNKPVDTDQLPDLDKFTIAGDYPSQSNKDDSQTKTTVDNKVQNVKGYGATDTLKLDQSKIASEKSNSLENSNQQTNETKSNTTKTTNKSTDTTVKDSKKNSDSTLNKDQKSQILDTTDKKSDENLEQKSKDIEESDKKTETQTTDSKQNDKKTEEQTTDSKQTDKKTNDVIINNPDVASSEKVKNQSTNTDTIKQTKKDDKAITETDKKTTEQSKSNDDKQVVQDKNINEKSGEIQGANTKTSTKKVENIKETNKPPSSTSEEKIVVDQKNQNPQQIIKKQIKNQFQYAQNKFSISLLYSMYQRSEFNSTILSPLSIGMQLGLLLNAVGSNTVREITSILQMKAFSKEQINLMFKKLLQSILTESQQKSSVKLFFYNYACFNTALPFGSSTFRKFFLDVGIASYFTEFVSYNLQTDDGYKNYGTWLQKISQNTVKANDQRIKSVSIIMHNYFFISGKWLYSFKKENTEDFFYNRNGQAVKIKYMHFERPIMTNIYQHAHFDMLLLPYSNEKIVFVMVIPNSNQSFSDIIQYLYTTTFDILFKRASAKPILLSLPKISISRKWDVMPTLNSMGLSHIPGLFPNGSTLINGLDHTVSFNFKETGLNAAPKIDEKIKDIVQIVANKPYIFFIYDQESGMILFEGLVQNLEQ